MAKPDTTTQADDKRADMERRNIALGKKVRDWEADLGELFDMSSVTATMIDDALSGEPLEGMPPSVHIVTKEQARQLLFCVFHTQEMVRAFREKYYLHVEA